MSIIKQTINGKTQYRYCCSYVDILGKRHRKYSKWFNTKKECIQEESKFLTDRFAKKTGYTFGNIAINYIEYTSKDNTIKTIKEKKSALKSYLSSLLDYPIDDITSAQIKTILEQEDIVRLSTSRKNRILGLINSIFKHAQMFYGLQVNPCEQIPRFKRTVSEKLKKMNIYTPNQFNAFLGAITDEKWVYKDLFFVLYWTGMRLNEANSLTFEDITQKRINLTKQFKDGKWTSLKTDGSVRKISIDNDIYDIFTQLEEYYSSFPNFDESWFCFGGYKQLSYTSIERVKNDAVEKSNLPYIRIHDFRHSHASNLIEAGVNMYKISKRLGHSSITITMDRYGHLIDEDGDEILNAIKTKS